MHLRDHCRVSTECGELLDPAIRRSACALPRWSAPVDVTADDHPGHRAPVKFPDAVLKADVGEPAHLPAHLSDLFERNERFTVLAMSSRRLQSYWSPKHGKPRQGSLIIEVARDSAAGPAQSNVVGRLHAQPGSRCLSTGRLMPKVKTRSWAQRGLGGGFPKVFQKSFFFPGGDRSFGPLLLMRG